MAFTLLMPIGVLVKGDSPVMGCRRERMGSVIYDVGALGTVMVNCFVSCPVMTVRIWRAWRMARHALCCGMQLRYAPFALRLVCLGSRFFFLIFVVAAC